MTTLYVRDGDQFREADNHAVIERANNLIAQRYRAGSPVLNAPSRTREFLRIKLGALEHEVFSALLLDTRHRLIAYVELFRGTIDGASVHPREVVKECLARNCAAVIFAHCHPLCFVRCVTVTANCLDFRRKPLSPSSEIKGNGVLPCFFGSYHAGLAVKALALLTRSRAFLYAPGGRAASL